MFSLIVPVYNNEGSIPDLLSAVRWIDAQLFPHRFETVFVVDGSPDQSYQLLRKELENSSVKAVIISLTRNFGSFAAIRTGLKYASGDYFAVMAADLQEPKELIVSFFTELKKNDCDVIIGTRTSRQDPLFSRLASEVYWSFYRRWIQPEIPKGGVDIFGCNKAFRDQLLLLRESHTSLIGLIFWLGFRRKYASYARNERKYGRSAWTLRKKLKYLTDSLFSFSDLPIRLLLFVGVVGFASSLALSSFIFISRMFGLISVPGYTATALFIMYFASLNSLALGVIGTYVWRTYENTKGRPESAVLFIEKNGDQLKLINSPITPPRENDSYHE